MIDINRLLEESETINQILDATHSKESLQSMDSYVLDFRSDLIEAFGCCLNHDSFDEVDKLVCAYRNYKAYLSKRKDK